LAGHTQAKFGNDDGSSICVHIFQLLLLLIHMWQLAAYCLIVLDWMSLIWLWL